MKEEWKDKLQNSLADFEESAPEGLWNDIDKALSVGDINTGRQHRRSNKTRTVAIGFLTAAACTAALVGIFLNNPKTESGNIAALAPKANEPSSKAATATAALTNDASTASGSTNRILAASAPARSNTAATTDKLLTSQEKTAALANESINETTGDAEDGKPTTSNEDTAVRQATKERQYATENKETPFSRSASRHVSDRHEYSGETHGSKYSGNKLTASLFASNSMSGGGTQTAMVMAASSNTMLLNMPSEGESAMAKYYVGRSENESVKHHQPVKMGLSVRYELTPQIGIETGLTYSCLSTDIKQGTDENCMLTQQKLHFVGIPVNVIYSFLKTRWVDAYVSAGGMAEKNIKGKSTTAYMLDNRQLSEESNNLKMKELQWSANISAGLQFNATKEVGIYIEPGIGYYFDNGSSLKTAYSDKPFNFNLKFGLRYSFE